MKDSVRGTHEDLVARIHEGDQSAEEELYKLFHRPLKTMLLARCGDPHLADDLVQDTFSILITRLRESPLKNPSALASFSHRTAVNVWIGHARKEARRKTTPDSEIIDKMSAESSTQLEALERTREDAAVRILLGELKNERDKEILFQTFVLDHDKKDVCRALNLTPANFDRVIYRAKSRFRKIVESTMGYQP